MLHFYYRFATVTITELTPESRAQHHSQEYNSSSQCLLVSCYAPVTVQRWSQNAKNGDLHRICHPAQTDAQRQLYLEPSEAKRIDGLRYRVSFFNSFFFKLIQN